MALIETFLPILTGSDAGIAAESRAFTARAGFDARPVGAAATTIHQNRERNRAAIAGNDAVWKR